MMKAEHKKPGRPPVSKYEPTEQVTVRLTPTQREKLARLGGASWVRSQLDQINLSARS